ncbi:MAG TPA: type II secretion system protein GspK [Rhizomicrobium sp.]|jgi:general secretion pathway protein K|nr:type II secretion system protein GspK [Rhizomicrobium sp.]
MSRQRGLALVSVLWGVAILSLIAAAMLSSSVTTAQLGHNAWNGARASAIADEAVNRAVLSLLDDRLAHQPRVDGVPATYMRDGASVRLWIQDESGKVNVNFASAELLQGLFVSAGLARDDAGRLADTIVARRPAAGFTGGSVAFHSLDELLALSGMSRALLARIEPVTTVYGRSTALNQQVASRQALRAIPGMDEDAITLLLKTRDANRPAPSGDDSTGASLGIADSAFAITVEVRLANARLVRSAVVQFTGDETKPYLVMAWR